MDLGRAMARQRRTKVYAMEYLKKMPPGTRAAVFGTWYPPGHLRVLQGVTSDPALLSAAVDSMPFDQDGLVMLAPRAGGPSMGPPEPPEDWCAQQERRNRMTIESLDRMASDLAQIKGRKNLLWFNTRIWTLILQDRPGCLTDQAKELQRAYGLLAAAQVTVFPISMRGVEMPSMEQTYDMLAMEAVAEATGGVAYYNSNDLGDLTAKAMNAGSEYYTLSYVPPGSEYDGRHHSIKIVAGKPGLKLTYRDEYYAEDPRTMAPTPGLTLAEVPDAKGPVDMRTAMGRSMPTSQQILFDVQVEPSSEPAKPGDPAVFGVLDVKLKTKPLTRYGFQYAFPGRQIAFTTAPDGTRHGSLEFDLAAYDGDGNVVTSLRQAIQLNLTADQVRELATSPFRYFQQLDLPPGALFLRVGVLDRTSNKVGTLEIPVTVAKTPAQHAAVGGR
jgi:VWFA-related protein